MGKEKRKPKIYIAGPMYTSGDMGDNIRNALDAAKKIKEAGGLPFVPHLYFFWDMIFFQPREFWLELDRDWVKDSDAVYRLTGDSKGGDLETGWAFDDDIPVFGKIRQVYHFIKTWNAES